MKCKVNTLIFITKQVVDVCLVREIYVVVNDVIHVVDPCAGLWKKFSMGGGGT